MTCKPFLLDFFVRPKIAPTPTQHKKLKTHRLHFHIIQWTKPSVSHHRVIVAQALQIPLPHLKRRVSEKML